MVISDITLALFEDSGWYKVKYYTGGLFRYGKNQGCDFLNSYCVNGDVSKYKNDFCITEQTTMCTPGRTHRAMCGLITYPEELEVYYRYFTNSRKGGYLSQADYCPVARTNSSYSRSFSMMISSLILSKYISIFQRCNMFALKHSFSLGAGCFFSHSDIES